MDLSSLNFERFQVEVLTTNFIVHGEFEPRGDAVVFLNDVNRDSYPIFNPKLESLNPAFKMPSIEQECMTIIQKFVHCVAFLGGNWEEHIQLVQSKRTAVFYTDCFVIRGDVHVSGEVRDDDMLENSKLFYPLTNADIFPLRQVAHHPHKHAPFLVLNRDAVVAYHAYHP